MNRSRSLKHTIIFLALFFVFQNELRSQTRAGESAGTVVGSVLDQSGAAILVPQTVIVFRVRSTKRKSPWMKMVVLRPLCLAVLTR